MANRTFLGSVHRNQPEQFEAPAGATLTPGMLAEVTSDELVPHASDGAAGFVYVAKELTGSFPAGGAVFEDYASGDTAQAYIPTSGEMYRMLIADAQDVGYDEPLTSNGDGLLRVGVPGTDTIVCYSDESLGTTSGTTAGRVKFQ